jgi:anti-sigma B factor antagonist
MAPYQSPSIDICPRDEVAQATVVWVAGEHDGGTRARLSRALYEAGQLDDGDVIVDLSGVTFMDASTVGTLVGAGNLLRAQSRSLGLRSPSRAALRALELCGLADIATSAPALRSWVEVPAIPPGAVVASEESAAELVKVRRGER